MVFDVQAMVFYPAGFPANETLLQTQPASQLPSGPERLIELGMSWVNSDLAYRVWHEIKICLWEKWMFF